MMSSSSRIIPPLLEPYLCSSSSSPSPLPLPPEASLTLLTHVLGASTNWLVLRYLWRALAGVVPPAAAPAAAVGPPRRGGTAPGEMERGVWRMGKGEEGGKEGEEGDEGEVAVVVLVSFLRDLRFWREGMRRLGLDLSKLAAQNRFAFVDGLSGLFLPGEVTGLGDDGEAVLRSAEPARVYEDVLGAVRSLQGMEGGRQGGKVLLVADGLDLLLATAGPNASSVGLGDMLMDLREHVHATILTISNDAPLVLRQQTPLEINHAAFLLSFAHQADLTISLRLLDTGTARDVSGVIRIGVGEAETAKGVVQVETKELLYFVAGDGNVKVFERGQ